MGERSCAKAGTKMRSYGRRGYQKKMSMPLKLVLKLYSMMEAYENH